jgi:2-polyprenyl-3-methyl-5-hydroxy-6-metoxy-1,4-benzoquinol methylase
VARQWNEEQFKALFKTLVIGGQFHEVPAYYARYKSRYRDLLMRYAAVAPTEAQDVLDVGGGQLALMCQALWGDRAHAADIAGPNLNYLKAKGVSTTTWNLCSGAEPFHRRFDVVFFTEVIEHLPVPGHVVLARLKRALKSKGTLFCTTPNLYRIRNLVFMLLGKRIFDHFQMPTDQGLGHVLEYSLEHLTWQARTAGFEKLSIELVQVHHLPNNLLFRLLYIVGSPVFFIPLYRDTLVLVAQNE